MQLSTYFLETPELKIPFNTFGYGTFATSEYPLDGTALSFPSHLMLGKQAEHLFEHWLKHSKRFQLIAANIQIQGERAPLGEIDYIVRDTNTQTVLHIELACKFYLLDPAISTSLLGKWIGPNRKDRLIEKLEKLQTKQFPLLHKEETAKTLAPLSLAVAAVQQQVCLKGFLFLPKYFREVLPLHFQKCVVGHYLSWQEIDSENDPKAQYALPNKSSWLIPPLAYADWHPFSEIKAQIRAAIEIKRAPLVYKKKGDTVAKFFVIWW